MHPPPISRSNSVGDLGEITFVGPNFYKTSPQRLAQFKKGKRLSMCWDNVGNFSQKVAMRAVVVCVQCGLARTCLWNGSRWCNYKARVAGKEETSRLCFIVVSYGQTNFALP